MHVYTISLFIKFTRFTRFFFLPVAWTYIFSISSCNGCISLLKFGMLWHIQFKAHKNCCRSAPDFGGTSCISPSTRSGECFTSCAETIFLIKNTFFGGCSFKPYCWQRCNTLRNNIRSLFPSLHSQVHHLAILLLHFQASPQKFLERHLGKRLLHL